MATRVEKRLTAIKVKSIKIPRFHTDGGGLYLRVEPGGSKSGALRITVQGNSRTIGLGSIRDMTLAEARANCAKSPGRVVGRMARTKESRVLKRHWN